jgi:hypothetical protein
VTPLPPFCGCDVSGNSAPRNDASGAVLAAWLGFQQHVCMEQMHLTDSLPFAPVSLTCVFVQAVLPATYCSPADLTDPEWEDEHPALHTLHPITDLFSLAALQQVVPTILEPDFTAAFKGHASAGDAVGEEPGGDNGHDNGHVTTTEVSKWKTLTSLRSNPTDLIVRVLHEGVATIHCDASIPLRAARARVMPAATELPLRLSPIISRALASMQVGAVVAEPAAATARSRVTLPYCAAFLSTPGNTIWPSLELRTVRPFRWEA